MSWLALFQPEGLSGAAALFLVVFSFFTSAVTAAMGLGGGVAMLAVLGMLLPVAALIPVHGFVQLGSNVGRAWHMRAHVQTRIALPFLIGSLVGAVLGLQVVAQLPDAPLKLFLGLFVLLVTWVSIPAMAGIGGREIGIGGAVVAFFTMLVGATGPLLSALFAQTIPDDRKALIATNAAGMTLHHALKVALYAFAGFSFARWLPLLGAVIASGYLGTLFGVRILERLPERLFRILFRLMLTALALDMVRRGIAGLV